MKCIVKLYNNECWYFYYEEDTGICFSQLDENGLMSESCILSSDALDDFDVICDENDALHLCCQNKTGELVYYRYINSSWSKNIILKSKFPSNNKKHFKLFSVNNWINALYTLEYRGKNILIHQILDKTKADPEIIDYIGESYTASKDSCGNIYAYFDSETNSSFGYKKYQWGQKEWTEFAPLHHCDNSSTFLNTFDNDDIPLIITSKNKAVHFITDNNDKIISTGEKPVLFCFKNTCTMQWTYKGKINGAISRDNCKTWEKLGTYNTSRNSAPNIFRVSVSPKLTDISCDYCYGYIYNDKIILLGLENIVKGNIINVPTQVFQEELTQNKVNISEQNTQNINTTPTCKPTDYSIQLNKIIISLGLLNETNTRIEKKLNRLENMMIDYNKTKELPAGSSKKHWFIRG